jgi:hypothetical protein
VGQGNDKKQVLNQQKAVDLECSRLKNKLPIIEDLKIEVNILEIILTLAGAVSLKKIIKKKKGYLASGDLER